MAAFVHRDLGYSYRRYLSHVPRDEGSRALLEVESMLVAAATAVAERRYTDAVASYEAARELLWAQLFPTIQQIDPRALGVDLTATLVSLGTEWLNVLAVEAPVAAVRPRAETAIGDGVRLGLHSAAVDAVGAAAVADRHLAELLEARGDAGSGQFFRQRAADRAPLLISSIEQAQVQGGRPFLAHRAVAEEGAGLLRLEAFRVGAGRFVKSAEVVEIPPSVTVEERSYAFRSGGVVKTVTWAAGQVARSETVLTELYEARKSLKLLPDLLLAPERASDVAVGLAHAWYYETPLGLAECHHALGDWAAAETWYLAAAGYAFLNAAVEAPYVWTRLATLYLDHGDALFRDGDAAAALPVYEKVITTAGGEPASGLWTTPGLAPGAAGARDVLAHLDDPGAITASPAIAEVVFEVWAQVQKIAGGLDFWGHWAANVPIWTYDYLQSAAVTFCQLAIGAERDALSFWEKADLGRLTRTQLVQGVAQSRAEQAAAQRQLDASRLEAAAFAAGEETARLRARNARANAADYERKSWDWTLHQAQSAQLAGGSAGNAGELNALADRMMGGSYRMRGERGTLSAAEQLAGSRIQREYEIGVLRGQATELDAAAQQAAQETAAARARSGAAAASAHAAGVRVAGAEQLVAAFDEQRFTPDVWNALGERMGRLAQRYLAMALDVAKRMQRAYNFENDTTLAIIRPDYAAVAVHGLLAADSLLADVQSFTYELVTSTEPKRQPVRRTISLAQRHPYLFESQFRRTGRMEFQTTLDDFDVAYPGTYGGRISHVEVEIDGIVAPRGISGTLTNAGISHYRVPIAVVAAGGAPVKHRVQNRETLVLSDHDTRTDALLVDDDHRRLGIFEGAGVASSWTLDVPPAVNELDYDAVTDVRLTVTYQARFDPDLRDAVVAELAARPAVHERQRPLPLRWLFPDAFFAFADTGVLAFSLGRADLPPTETEPTLTGLGLIVVTTPRTRAEGLVLRVTAPGSTPVTGTVAADGTVPADALAATAGAKVLGDWRIELSAADNPGWVQDGALALDPLDNLSVLLSYAFAPRV